jgi:predicted PurR-regulated permease PerM
MIKDGWQSISKLFFAAIALDLIYQFIELPLIYLRQAIIVAFLLAIVPYLVLRGAVTRLASRLMTRRVA